MIDSFLWDFGFLIAPVCPEIKQITKITNLLKKEKKNKKKHLQQQIMENKRNRQKI